MRKVLFILAELTDQDIDWMLAVGEKKQISSGSTLIREGQPIHAMYIVLDGTLSVFITRRTKKELARLGAGEIIGEMSFVDARPPSATVEALRNSVVLSIPVRDLQTRLGQDPGFAGRFYRALAVFLSSRLRSAVGRLGYGDDWENEDAKGDELDANVLDGIHMAGAKFDRMLKRLMGN